MTDSIGDLLGKKRMDQPPEIQAIKEFVRDAFQADCSVSITNDALTIGVTSGALASSLRMHIPELRGISNDKRRIIIRIVS